MHVMDDAGIARKRAGQKRKRSQGSKGRDKSKQNRMQGQARCAGRPAQPKDWRLEQATAISAALAGSRPQPCFALHLECAPPGHQALLLQQSGSQAATCVGWATSAWRERKLLGQRLETGGRSWVEKGGWAGLQVRRVRWGGCSACGDQLGRWYANEVHGWGPGPPGAEDAKETRKGFGQCLLFSSASACLRRKKMVGGAKRMYHALSFVRQRGHGKGTAMAGGQQIQECATCGAGALPPAPGCQAKQRSMRKP